jgi:hypothetical protein
VLGVRWDSRGDSIELSIDGRRSRAIAGPGFRYIAQPMPDLATR